MLARQLARRTLAFLAVYALIATQAARAEAPRTYAEAHADGAELTYQHGIPLAVLSGTPEDLGREQAALLAEPAKTVLKFPKKLVKEIGLEPVWPLMVGAGRMLMFNAPE